MTKARFTEICTEEGVPSELIEGLWESRPPSIDADRGRERADLIVRVAIKMAILGAVSGRSDEMLLLMERLQTQIDAAKIAESN